MSFCSGRIYAAAFAGRQAVFFNDLICVGPADLSHVPRRKMAEQQHLKLKWEFEGNQQTREVQAGQSLVIGRLPECDVVIPEQKVSRRHAQITGRQQGGRLVFELKNLSQTNTVFFSAPADLAPLDFDQTVIIPDGCHFLIGSVMISASLPQPQTPQPDNLSIKMPKVRCANCRELVDANLKDCPWCGTTLAFGGTYI